MKSNELKQLRYQFLKGLFRKLLFLLSLNEIKNAGMFFLESSLRKLNQSSERLNTANSGLRRDGITFEYSEDELSEYMKCALDIQHFAEKYSSV